MSNRKVLIPVDSSENSEKALRWYCHYISKEGDVVLLVHCIEMPPMPEKRFPYAYDYYGEWRTKIDELRTSGKALLRHFKDICKQSGIQPSRIHELLEDERPDHAIIRVAKEKEADLIVIGARGLGTLRRTVLGSVSDFVVHHSPIPVTVVPRGAWRHRYPHPHTGSVEELEKRERTKTC